MFLQEVFKSDFCDNVPMNKVLGKCYVMFVKEYFKLKPEVGSDGPEETEHLAVFGQEVVPL